MSGERIPTLILIGGHEDKEGDKVILREVARRAGPGKLVVTTVASSEPDGQFAEYEALFKGLGVKQVAELPIAARAEARADDRVRVLDGATAVFFPGGDQLKITSQIGDTPVFRRLRELYDNGGLVAGTSAGASVVCETMLVSGDSEQSPRVGEIAQMAPGLGLVGGVLVDQHFAERGRMGRLLGAVAQNPKILGIGIDEDTAVVVEGGRSFRVLGGGCVYLLDGAGVSDSNISEADAEHALSIFGVTLHALSEGDCFDLPKRRPGKVPQRPKREKEPAPKK